MLDQPVVPTCKNHFVIFILSRISAKDLYAESIFPSFLTYRSIDLASSKAVACGRTQRHKQIARLVTRSPMSSSFRQSWLGLRRSGNGIFNISSQLEVQIVKLRSCKYRQFKRQNQCAGVELTPPSMRASRVAKLCNVLIAYRLH